MEVPKQAEVLRGWKDLGPVWRGEPCRRTIAVPRKTHEKEGHFHIESTGGVMEFRGADTVGTAFIFLDLLEGHAQPDTEHHLGQAEGQPLFTQPGADMDVDRIEPPVSL
ncbi:hypothetical protein C8J36_110102 [Rhizobium sp. PP-F2F-G48]|nr:hypothetical protein C8J36_110102 [Rhizobium sp. PP-F2F-G48]